MKVEVEVEVDYPLKLFLNGRNLITLVPFNSLEVTKHAPSYAKRSRKNFLKVDRLVRLFVKKSSPNQKEY